MSKALTELESLILVLRDKNLNGSIRVLHQIKDRIKKHRTVTRLDLNEIEQFKYIAAL
jgi:hypothetical protein